VPFRLTVRSGPRVRHLTFPSLPGALEELEAQARALAAGATGEAVNAGVRRFEAGDRVIARIELAGPQRLAPSVRAGVDVRGDGTVSAYRGRLRRAPLLPRRGESVYAALRRELTTG